MSDIEDLSKRLQSAQTDSMGRTYNYSPGKSPNISIQFEDALDVKELSISLCRVLEREILLDFIKNDIVIFKRSFGRTMTSMKESYVLTLKTHMRCLLEIDWIYCIEVTSKYDELPLDRKYQVLMKQLKRIPERINPSGILITFDSFSGFEEDLSKINSILPNKSNGSK